MGSDENCVFKISFADNIVSEQAFILVEDEPVIYKHHYSHLVQKSQAFISTDFELEIFLP